MKRYIILVLVITHVFSVNAQQLPEVSYYMYDHARTNPGSFGSKDMICATFISKQSMVGMPGAPRNFFLNGSVPFNLLGAKHGAGISIYSDKIGFYDDIDVRLGYAFRFKVGDGMLGVGINGGIRQKKIEANWQSNGSPIDPASDNNIPQGTVDANSFGFSAGLFYRAEEVYFGASVANVYASEIDYSKKATGTTGLNAKEQLRPNYYATVGYSFQLTNPSYEIDPSVQFFSDGTSVTFDINGTVTYNKKVWFGVSYRAGAAAIGMAGLTIMDGLKVGYAYDFNTSALNKHSSGGHEVILNYCFKVGGPKVPQRYKSIRYL